MSHRAWAYIWSVLIAAVALAGFSVLHFTLSVQELYTFGALTVLATIAQLFEAEHGKQSYYPHYVFFFAGIIVLQPTLFVLLVAIPHLIEWGKERVVKGPHLRNWYIQPFNIAMHVLAGMVARWTFQAVQDNSGALLTLSPVLSAAIAVCAYVTVNHLCVGQALVLARNVSWRQSKVLDIQSIMPDLVMSLLGYVVAILWERNPWLLLPALSPLVLMYQALMVPQLKEEAQTDGKTGLWNARHWATLFTGEIDRAKRFDRPLALIMADLDLLRNVNNTYGHLAGDTVLSGIGRIISQNVREYDMPGRFGGEEFAIVLPETSPAEARAVAERLREAVEAASFTVASSSTPVGVTMSIGISCFPYDAANSTDLLHEADVAVYRAKLNGRNCVVCATDVPHSVDLADVPTNVDRLSSPHVHTFIPRPRTADGITPEQIPAASEYAAAGTSANSANSVTVTVQAARSANPLSVEAAASRSSTAAASAAPSQGAVESHGHEKVAQPHKLFRPFLTGVIAAGLLMTVFGIVIHRQLDLVSMGLLATLAVLAEVFQVDLYGKGTVSVSVAVNFAAALVAGLPGVALVSVAIVLAHRVTVQRNLSFDIAALYKTAFNWSTHVLAGMLPALAIYLLNVPFRLENMLLLLLPAGVAAVAYFIVDTGLIATAIGLTSRTSPVSVWKGQFRWLAGHYLALSALGLFLGVAYTAFGWLGVLVFTLPIFMMRYAQKQYVESTEDSMRELQRLNQELSHANHEVVSASHAMSALNEELFLTLSKIIDARDPYVSGHAAKVADYALEIARDLGMEAHRIEPLRQAGFLHDIGKIAISEQVLHKPAKLTPEEYEYIKTHAALGGEFLETARGLRHLSPFVRHHHERWNGLGYPDGLKGEEIELEARILAVCDSVEAMASDRPYHRGMTLGEIIDEVKRCAGTQFDPMVAESFVRIAEREREHLVVNSAQEVLKRQTLRGDALNYKGGPNSGYLPPKGSLVVTGPLNAVKAPR
ncbi:MAG: diguanylate cyclase [Chloroflexota bacterium]|nr:diguanylate cyclase [Chloroflexota bacterium]